MGGGEEEEEEEEENYLVASFASGNVHLFSVVPAAKDALVDKKIDEIYYIKKVCFEGIRGDKIIESGLFANSRSHNLKKIIIYDPKSLKVFSDYYLLKAS